MQQRNPSFVLLCYQLGSADTFMGPFRIKIWGVLKNCSCNAAKHKLQKLSGIVVSKRQMMQIDWPTLN